MFHPYKYHCDWGGSEDIGLRVYGVGKTDEAKGRISACREGHGGFVFG